MKRTKELLKKLDKEDFNTDELHSAICLDISDNLGADLVSLWSFDSELSQIECLFCLDTTSNESSSAQVLKRNDFPTYFSYIVEDNVVCAPNARTHFATKELTEKYFKPNGIVSLLDFILQKDFKPSGIICCEARKSEIDWTVAHRTYLRSIASLISFRFDIIKNS
ncbi:hypothetical protein MLD52_02740 [Puniceicoccaceae bacterium K14]|nr:hypothetical protein [Puniceicoccaceae bacterium K14]